MSATVTQTGRVATVTVSTARYIHPNHTGDVTSAGDGVTTLANTAVTAGSYTAANITVDSKGRITAASNTSSLAPTAHASTHATGGSDPLTPASIGAETPAGAAAQITASAVRYDASQSLTSAQRRTARENILAETTNIAWVERFARHANGTAIGTGSTTENGQTWFMNNQPGFSSATIVNAALESQDGDLYYIGGAVPCPGKRFSLTVIAELRDNPNYNGSGTADAGIILSNGPVNFNAGLASYLNSGVTHCQFYATNPAMVINPFYDPTFPGGAPAFTTDAEVTNQLPIIGKRLLINISVRDGVLAATMGGQTKIYRSASFAQTMNETATGFFVEAGRNVTQRYTWAVHAIWVNSPSLDSTEFGGTQSQASLDFFRRDRHVLPGVLRMFPTGAGYAGGTLPTLSAHAAGTSTTAKGSQLRINGGNILAEGGFVGTIGYSAAPVLLRAPMNRDLGLDAQVLSTAGAESALLTIAATPALENGDMETLEFAGNLTGTNAKRIRLFRSAGAATIFDTDAAGTPLTAVTGPWLLTVRRNVTASASYIISHFEASGVSILQRSALNFGNNTISLQILTTTADAGAVSLEFALQELQRVNIS
jgi:hypothetical protein